MSKQKIIGKLSDRPLKSDISMIIWYLSNHKKYGKKYGVTTWYSKARYRFKIYKNKGGKRKWCYFIDKIK